MTVRQMLEAQGLDPQAVLDLELGDRAGPLTNSAEAHLVEGWLTIELHLTPQRGAHQAD